MWVIVSPATESGRADTQQYGSWDTELDCVPMKSLASTPYISFVIKRVTILISRLFVLSRGEIWSYLL